MIYAKRLFLFATLTALLGLAACAPKQTTSFSATGFPTIDGGGKTGFTGEVLTLPDNKPLEGAHVYIYPDTSMNLLGPAQYISTPTDKDGRYLVELEPGNYFVVARKRTSGSPTGPLSPGDYYSEHQRLQAQVPANRLVVVNLATTQMKAPMFFKREAIEATDTGIRGILVDAQGNPVQGGFGTAYKTNDTKRIPDFISTLTGSDGKFTLFLPEGGTYYISGRIHAWDMPKPGELFGRLGTEDNPQGIPVKKGSFVENVRIEMTPFEGQYQKGKSQRPF